MNKKVKKVFDNMDKKTQAAIMVLINSIAQKKKKKKVDQVDNLKGWLP
jgi:hypothetical protein